MNEKGLLKQKVTKDGKISC